jgi:hypothetical protein
MDANTCTADVNINTAPCGKRHVPYMNTYCILSRQSIRKRNAPLCDGL